MSIGVLTGPVAAHLPFYDFYILGKTALSPKGNSIG